MLSSLSLPDVRNSVGTRVLPSLVSHFFLQSRHIRLRLSLTWLVFRCCGYLAQ
jgi:hypothetical protein